MLNSPSYNSPDESSAVPAFRALHLVWECKDFSWRRSESPLPPIVYPVPIVDTVLPPLTALGEPAADYVDDSDEQVQRSVYSPIRLDHEVEEVDWDDKEHDNDVYDEDGDYEENDDEGQLLEETNSEQMQKEDHRQDEHEELDELDQMDFETCESMRFEAALLAVPDLPSVQVLLEKEGLRWPERCPRADMRWSRKHAAYWGDIHCYGLLLLVNAQQLTAKMVVDVARERPGLLPFLRQQLRPDLAILKVPHELHVCDDFAEVQKLLTGAGFSVQRDVASDELPKAQCTLLATFPMVFGVTNVHFRSNAVGGQSKGSGLQTWYLEGYHSSVDMLFLEPLWEALRDELPKATTLLDSFGFAIANHFARYDRQPDFGPLIERARGGQPAFVMGLSEIHAYALVFHGRDLYYGNRGYGARHTGVLKYRLPTAYLSEEFLRSLVCPKSMRALQAALDTLVPFQPPAVVATKTTQMRGDCTLNAAHMALYTLICEVEGHDWEIYQRVLLRARIAVWNAASKGVFGWRRVDLQLALRSMMVQARLLVEEEEGELFALPVHVLDVDLLANVPALLWRMQREEKYIDTRARIDVVSLPSVADGVRDVQKRGRHKRQLANRMQVKYGRRLDSRRVSDGLLEEVLADGTDRHPYLRLLALCVLRGGAGVSALWKSLSPDDRRSVLKEARRFPGFTLVDALLHYAPKLPDLAIAPEDFEAAWEMLFLPEGPCEEGIADRAFHGTLLASFHPMVFVRFERTSLKTVYYHFLMADWCVQTRHLTSHQQVALNVGLPHDGFHWYVPNLETLLEEASGAVRNAWLNDIAPLLRIDGGKSYSGRLQALHALLLPPSLPPSNANEEGMEMTVGTD